MPEALGLTSVDGGGWPGVNKCLSAKINIYCIKIFITPINFQNEYSLQVAGTHDSLWAIML